MPFLSQYTFFQKANFLLRDLLVFFLIVSTTLLTTYFGGITIYKWTWSLFIPNLYTFPIRIIFPYFLQFYFQITFYSGYQNHTSVSGYSDDMVFSSYIRYKLPYIIPSFHYFKARTKETEKCSWPPPLQVRSSR